MTYYYYDATGYHESTEPEPSPVRTEPRSAFDGAVAGSRVITGLIGAGLLTAGALALYLRRRGA